VETPRQHEDRSVGDKIAKMIQEHMKLIEKFPHRIQKANQRDTDQPFNPRLHWQYETSKQVDW
jgi:hypothetical protein